MRSASRLQITAAILATLVVGALLPATASAVAPANDFWNNPSSLALNLETINHSNVDATHGTEPGFEEPYTNDGPLFCNDNNTGEMGSTVWFRVPGTGGPLNVTVARQGTFDPMVAAYDSNNNALDCNDDAVATTRDSFLTFNSTAGANHLIQVGGFWNSGAGTASQGLFDITVLSNDLSNYPETVTPGTYDKSNIGASEVGGENLSCEGTSYNSTVWFRYVAPEYGDVTFHVSRFKLAVGIYKGDSRVACDGSSPAVLSAAASSKLEAGETVLVQVGGVPVSAGQPNQGNFALHVIFDRDCDRDDDSVFDENRATCQGRDCDDTTRDINPAKPEIVNNGVDENCDRYKEHDKDGDGYRMSDPIPDPKPTNYDCNDTPGVGFRIHPGARDVRGNNLNEDCKGGKAKAIGLPSSITDNWSGKPGGAAVSIMKIKPALKGSRIRMSCSGSGCPFKSKKIPVRRRTKAFVLTGLFRGHVLKSGAKLVVKVLPPSAEWIGKSETYRIRGSSVLSTPGCLNVRGVKVKCPS